MIITVQQLANISGVSVRTLHYYDEIGLLKPSFFGDNKYRYYEKNELLKLQQILFYRELEFPLEEIKKILQSPNFNAKEALNDQRKLLMYKKERISDLLKTIEKTIKSLEGGENMNNDDLYSGFSQDQIEEYKKEAKEKWGNTDAWKQSQSRTKNWTKADYKKVFDEHGDIATKLAALMDKDVSDEKVQEQIERQYQYVSIFYDCPIEMFRNLGIMYVEDKRFTKTYDKFKLGLAVFLRDAIAYYCDQRNDK